MRVQWPVEPLEQACRLVPLPTPLRKFNINHAQLAYVFSIVWLRLAAWDY